jgi:hypothetical protein
MEYHRFLLWAWSLIMVVLLLFMARRISLSLIGDVKELVYALAAWQILNPDIEN